MKYLRYILALMIVALFLPNAFSQEEIMLISHEELGVHQRPLVQFHHGKHAAILECVRCHHEYDEYGNNTGGEGQLCSECHTPKAGENPVPLVRAFHLQCKGCHENLLTKGRKTGPAMCGQCHIKKQQ